MTARDALLEGAIRDYVLALLDHRDGRIAALGTKESAKP
jgi:hypothetical protein